MGPLWVQINIPVVTDDILEKGSFQEELILEIFSIFSMHKECRVIGSIIRIPFRPWAIKF